MKMVYGLGLLMLGGCSVLSEVLPEQELWRPYQDLDGQKQYISFTEQTNAMEYQKPMLQRNLKQFQGYAKRQTKYGGSEIIGYVTALMNGNGMGMLVIFNVNGQSLNPHKAEDVAKLAAAQSFEFYEFGQYRLSQARFKSKNGICRDFAKGQVSLAISSNYYPDNSFTDYHTVLVSAFIGQNDIDGVVYKPSFNGNDADLQRELREVESAQGRKVAQDNLKEKASILSNIICRSHNQS